jgi:hypothetical protein
MGSRDVVFAGNGVMPQGIEQLSRPAQRQAKHEIERVITQGLVVNIREEVRAVLANTALQNAGALSELEGYLCRIAPSGASRYQHIVDAYALGAANVIARW